MALDPRIPLGVQPIQQPNMLGQYGQLIALQAAQEEMRGSRDMRKLFAGGADFDNPEFVAQGYAANPKEFQELLGKRATADKAKAEAIKSQIELRRDALSSVNTPEDYLSWHDANHRGALGEFFKSAGINPSRESIIAKLSAPGGLDKLKRESALGATKLQQELMQTERSIQSANIGAGATMRGQDLTNARAIEEREYARANPTLSQVQGENGFYLYNPRDPNSAVPLGMAPSAPPPPVAQQSPVNNMLMPSQSVQPSVNALVQPAPNQPGAPTVANANALAPQSNIIRPKQPVRQPVAVIKDGEVLLVSPEEAVGMTPATPGAEKILEKKTIATEGKKSVDDVLKTLYSEYDSLLKSGGITDVRQSLADNIAARTGATEAGQFASGFTGSSAQSFRDAIEQTRPLLLTSIMKATGLSATQLNSNVELQTYLKTATDTKVSIQSNVKALNNISKMFGLGEEFKVPEVSKATPAGKPAEAPPAGLSPEIAGLWQYMTPEDRKLWQK